MKGSSPAKAGGQLTSVTSGSEKVSRGLRILLESLFRAAIQGIPYVGSSLDQLTYGIRDAKAAEKLRSAVESLSAAVDSLLNQRRSANLDKVPELADSLVEFGLPKRVLEVFESQGPSFVALVAHFVRRLEDKLDEGDENRQLVAENVERFRVTFNEDAKELKQEWDKGLRLQRAQIDRVEKILARVERASARGSTFSKSSLSRIRGDLLALEPQALIGVANTFRDAAAWMQSTQSSVLAVDTHEVIEYALSPLKGTTNSLNVFLASVFSNPFGTPRTLYLLPETSTELLSYLQRNLEWLTDYRRVVSSLGRARRPEELMRPELLVLSEAVAPNRSPLRRLQNLLEGRRLSFHLPSEESRRAKDIMPLARAMLRCLSDIRPPKHVANWVDACALARIGLLNEERPGSAALISSSPAMQKAARSLSRLIRQDSRHLVVAPELVVSRDYLSTSRDQERLALLGAARSVIVLPHLRASLLENFSRGDVEQWVSSASFVAGVRNGVRAFQGGLDPFYDAIRSALTHDWGLDSEVERPIEERDFGSACERTYEILSCLLQWLAPLEEALRPFRELTAEIKAAEGDQAG